MVRLSHENSRGNVQNVRGGSSVWMKVYSRIEKSEGLDNGGPHRSRDR
jgi:hypothetical protein